MRRPYNQHDIIWPRDEAMMREIELSRCIARRDAEARRRRELRRALLEILVALAVLAAVVLVIWIIAPAWYLQ